jgi:hypothetical protein
MFVVIFQVLAVTSMKITAFWDTAPCSLVEVNRCFRGEYCLHHASIVALTTQAVLTSETVYFNDTTRRYIAEGVHLDVWYFASLMAVHIRHCRYKRGAVRSSQH